MYLSAVELWVKYLRSCFCSTLKYGYMEFPNLNFFVTRNKGFPYKFPIEKSIENYQRNPNKTTTDSIRKKLLEIYQESVRNFQRIFQQKPEILTFVGNRNILGILNIFPTNITFWF